MSSPAELRSQIVETVGALQPETMTGEQAAEAVAAFATIEKAAAAGRMFAALRVAQTDAWRGQGHASAADWLAAHAGITVREAQSQLGTARKADRLPKTKRAMRKGKLSPGQAGSVTDGASADPAAEDDLLDTAERDTAAKLREEAARVKAAATDSAQRERRIRAQRSVRTRTDAEGGFHLHLYGPAADGARIVAMLRPYEQHVFDAGRHAGVRDSFDNRSYDAFITMLAHLAAQTGQQGPAPAGSAPPEQPDRPKPPDAAPTTPEKQSPGAAPAPPEGDPAEPPPSPLDPWADLPTRLPGGNNTKVIVRIDHTALARGHTIAGERCDIAGLGPISVATAKALMEDAFLAALITKGRDVHTVAHLGRGLNAHQRTAIEWTGTACTNLACNRTVATQINHRVPLRHQAGDQARQPRPAVPRLPQPQDAPRLAPRARHRTTPLPPAGVGTQPAGDRGQRPPVGAVLMAATGAGRMGADGWRTVRPARTKGTRTWHMTW